MTVNLHESLFVFIQGYLNHFLSVVLFTVFSAALPYLPPGYSATTVYALHACRHGCNCKYFFYKFRNLSIIWCKSDRPCSKQLCFSDHITVNLLYNVTFSWWLQCLCNNRLHMLLLKLLRGRVVKEKDIVQLVFIMLTMCCSNCLYVFNSCFALSGRTAFCVW